MTQGIYKILNLVSGTKYVGSSSNITQRKRRHFKDLRAGTHHARYLQRAWNKYGSCAFEFSVLEEVMDPHDLVRVEQRWIDALGACGPTGYNSHPNASSAIGFRHTPEAIRKIGEASRARPRGPLSDEAIKNIKAAAIKRSQTYVITEETRERLRASSSGRVMSAEARRKISDSRKGKPVSELQRLSMLGRVRSEEHRAKHRAAILGKRHSPETKAKMSAARKGKPKSAETRERMSQAAKARCARQAATRLSV